MVRAEMFCRPLPVVFVAIGVENRFSRNVVLAEYFSDIVLVFGRKEAFFPIETVVFPPSEVSNQQTFQGVKALVGYVVEQVADSPRNMYLLCRQEVGALVVVFGDAQRVDDMDGGIFGGVAKCGKAAQAVVGFGTLGIEAAREIVRCQRLFCSMFHIICIYRQR